MQPNLTATQLNLLRMIFDRGAEAASQALSKWLGRRFRLTISEVELSRAGGGGELLGPAGIAGRRLLDGADRPADRLDPPGLRGPLGAGAGRPALASAGRDDDGLGRARAIGRQGDDQHRRLCVCQRPGGAPAAPLAAASGAGQRWKPGKRTDGDLVPTPPTFVHEFAGSLLEFALMEQALELDQVLLIRSELRAAGTGLNLDWTLLVRSQPRVAARAARVAAGARIASLVMNRDERSADRARCELDGRPRFPRDRLRGDRPVGGCGCAGEDPDAAGLVCGRRALRSGGEAGGRGPHRAALGTGNADHPGKYADTAIPALIADFERRLGTDYRPALDRQARRRSQHVPG